MGDTNAPIDEAVLQTLAGTLRTDDRISSVVLVSSKDVDEHKHLAVTLDPTRYPEHIEQARIEFQWYRLQRSLSGVTRRGRCLALSLGSPFQFA